MSTSIQKASVVGLFESDSGSQEAKSVYGQKDKAERRWGRRNCAGEWYTRCVALNTESRAA